MSSNAHGTAIRHVHTLFNAGAVGGLTDRELLELFKVRRGEAAESAFAAIVERHGPMVHRVCRQVLADPDAADDAFQATFLVLIQKASLLNLTDSLAPWLHGVALRVASCARSARVRRQAHERRAGEERMRYASEGGWDDLGAVLHEEIHRLPERYRTPVLLCWLEGLSTEAAGQRLRCPQGTILSRLSRARERLRQRLTRRGVTPAGVLGMASFTEAASGAVPQTLINSTIRTASHIIARKGAGVVSARVTALTKEVLVAMLFSKVKVTATALLMIGSLLAGVGVLARQETAPSRKGHVEPEAPTSPLTHPDNTPATLDRVAKDFDIATEQFMRQIRGTVAVLGRESNPHNGKLALHFRNRLNQVESEVRGAQEHLAGWLGPPSANFPLARAGEDNDPSLSPAGKSIDRSSASGQRPEDLRTKGQHGSDVHQPTLRAGGYIFTASPTGNKAIAYDPTTRGVKSVQLNATNEHPLKVTPMTGDHVQLVALRIQGSKITRVAVFDLESDKWLPMDLDEPVKGDVQPVYLGHSGTAYDFGRNVYTYNAKAKKWDYLDIITFSDDVEDEGAAKASASGRASK
jgi:RNA polymerase sigma factor (sigma-70 family)